MLSLANMSRSRSRGLGVVGILAVAASAWVALLGFATWNSTRRSTGIAASVAATGVYAAAALLCHQKPERSFHWRGVQLPVCGRCVGLYVGGTVGLGLAAVSKRLLPHTRLAVRLLLVAGGLNLGTFVVEWFGGAGSNGIRAATGALLGATGALAIAALALADESDEVN